MRSYTVFAYGTLENHETTKSFITQFSKACESAHSILNGPSLLGKEVNQNAQSELNRFLEWLDKQEGIEHNLNFTGYSRGAVTGLYLVNHLKKRACFLEKNDPDSILLAKLKALKINLFLVDPVAGLTAKRNHNARIIPDNVTNCVVILQKDERRRPFKPQDMSRLIVKNPKKTQLSLLPLFGVHSDILHIKHEEMTSGPTIIWHTLFAFLSHHGTKFMDAKIPQMIFMQSKEPFDLPKDLNAKDYLVLFSKHHDERPHYFNRGISIDVWDGISASKIERTFNRSLKFYVKNPDFFVNQLERELFKLAYPQVFNYYFEKNLYDSRFPHASCSSPASVVLELSELEKADKSLYQRMKQYLIKNGRQGTVHDAALGLSYLEPCIGIQQIFPQIVPNEVKDRATEFKELAVLEMTVYRYTFQYQRDKSAWNVFGSRARCELARVIREEVHAIVNESDESPDSKKQRVLDRLEMHYKELVLSNSMSELRTILKYLLSENNRSYTITQSGINLFFVQALHISLSLFKECISFLGHLGYIGGTIIYAIGHILEVLGNRMKELMYDTHKKPWNAFGYACGSIIEFFGFIIKNNFGLKPLTEQCVKSYTELEECLIRKVNTSVIEPEYTAPKQEESGTHQLVPV